MAGACVNPEILRIFYLFLVVIDIVRIVVPIALIILGTIDLSKAVITSDEKIQKNTVNLFFKRILNAILIFAIPWIVKTLMIAIGDATGKGVNFTDCFENANNSCISALASENAEKIEKNCIIYGVEHWWEK